MAYRKSKYGAEFTQELTMRTLGVLAESPTALTIDEICIQDQVLVGQTSQKMSRVLGELCNMGLAFKTKDKHKGRMVYMSAASLKNQGFDLDNLVY